MSKLNSSASGSRMTRARPPAAPTALAATAGDGSVALDWADNVEGDLDGYTVYRATSSGGPYTALTGGLLSSSDYVDNAVTNGTTYYYVVTALDTASNESSNSSEAVATPTALSSASRACSASDRSTRGTSCSKG